MKKGATIMERMITNVAYRAAKRNANSACAAFFHQPVLPERVKKLRTF